ncbi:MAG: cytidylate kinase family protein [bacterium]
MNIQTCGGTTSDYPHRITVTGLSGVGTTSFCEALVKTLGEAWRHTTAGDAIRRIAESKGMAIEEFVEYCRSNPESDLEVDAETQAMGRVCQMMVFEGRLAHYNVPNAFHILINCPPNVCAKRPRKNNQHLTETEREINLRARDMHDNARYERLYGREVLWSEDKYNLVLDSNFLRTEEMVNIAILEFSLWLYPEEE